MTEESSGNDTEDNNTEKAIVESRANDMEEELESSANDAESANDTEEVIVEREVIVESRANRLEYNSTEEPDDTEEELESRASGTAGDTDDEVCIASFQAPTEFLETFQEMGRDFMACATAEFKSGFKLSENLIAARSLPDAVAAYGEWFSEELETRVDGARQMVSYGQKFMDCGSRLLRSGWMSSAWMNSNVIT